MSHSSRKSKFQAKLSTKVLEKSSLPEIDPLHLTNTKHGSDFIIKHPQKTVKERNHNNLSFTKNNFKPMDIDLISHTNRNSKNQQHEHTFHCSKAVDQRSIEIEKQLMTVDTARPEYPSDKVMGHQQAIVTSGLDLWNLNKNLKQFSETRKLPFYKNDNHHTTLIRLNAIQSLAKNRTQQIRSMYKIYGGGDATRMIATERETSQGHLNYKKFVQPISKVKLNQKDAKSFSAISNTKLISPLGNTLYGTLPVRKHNSNFETIYSKKQSQRKPLNQEKVFDSSLSHLNPYLRTFINGSHLKRQSSNRNIHILEMNTLTTKEKIDDGILKRNQEKKQTNFRKNRFQIIKADKNSTVKHFSNFEDYSSKSSNLELSVDQMSQDQGKYDESIQIHEQVNCSNLAISLTEKSQFDKVKNASNKKPYLEYLKLIERINKLMLKSSEQYLEKYYTFSKLPISKIEFYIDSLNHSELASHRNEYKSSYRGQIFEQHNSDFFIKDDKVHETERSKRQTSLKKNKKQITKSKFN